MNAQAPAVGPVTLATIVVIAVVGLATATDLRERRVPLWLSVGTIVVGLTLALAAGGGAVESSLLGLVVGVVVLLPMVLLGGFGGGDALLLGAIGTWQGWWFVMHAALWTAVAGGLLAVVAWRRGQRAFAYVPAIAVGTILALFTS
jgi:Flp pilus assembly protein protease CpaA